MACYCWHCYGRNECDHGPCSHYGQEISPPHGMTEIQKLLWGTRHPDPDVAIMCARRLAAEGDESVLPQLRELITDPPDPYVAMEALRTLLSLSSVDQEGPWLEQLSRDAPFMLRRVAERALQVLPGQ